MMAFLKASQAISEHLLRYLDYPRQDLQVRVTSYWLVKPEQVVLCEEVVWHQREELLRVRHDLDRLPMVLIDD